MLRCCRCGCIRRDNCVPRELSFSTAGEPSDGKPATEFFEVTVGGDEGSAMLQGKSGGNAVYVGDFVKRLQFASFDGLGRSTGTIWIGRRERPSSV